MNQHKRIHFIGICGVAMSALALAFKKLGWVVTGSDVGFYPPVSTYLKDAGVDYYAGWHPDRVLHSFSDGGKNDELVVVGNVASSTNPEWQYVQEHKLNYKSYPEVIAAYFVKQNSIVCAGTYGKTTTSALMTWILKEAGFDPSYMFGGLMATPVGAWHGKPLPSAAITDGDWSVLEGDEYKASKWDNRAKFFYYSPTHLLLTAIVWDHADVYQTEEEYFEAFKKLVEMIPENGLKIISEQAAPIVISNEAKRREKSSSPTNRSNSLLGESSTSSLASASSLGVTNVITYGKSANNDYIYSDITQSKFGISFTITSRISPDSGSPESRMHDFPPQENRDNSQFPISSHCLGEYMADNITGCFALASEIGIAPEKIIAAIKTFPGMKRRLEKRFEGKITIFDDIAHSPVKAKSVLETLGAIYRPSPRPSLLKGGKVDLPLRRKETSPRIIAIFEPNTGNRRPQAKPWFDNAFAEADEVIIPKLTKVKVDTKEEPPLEGDELAAIIAKTHGNARYMEDDQEVISYIQQKTQPGDVVVFMGSHGFRGMIEELIHKLSF